jgi:hypothetical protein
MQEDFEEQNREIVELDMKLKQCESPALAPNLWCAACLTVSSFSHFDSAG